jgi:integrase
MSDYRARKGSANWHAYDPQAFARLAAHLRRTADVLDRRSMLLLARLVLRTGVRETELQYGEWHDVDFERRVWTIPAENQKERRTLRLPLSDSAIRVLRALQRDARGDDRIAPLGAKHLRFKLAMATRWLGSSGASYLALREEAQLRLARRVGLKACCAAFAYNPTGKLPKALTQFRAETSGRAAKAAIGVGGSDAVHRQDQRRGKPERLRGQGLPPLPGGA